MADYKDIFDFILHHSSEVDSMNLLNLLTQFKYFTFEERKFWQKKYFEDKLRYWEDNLRKE